METKISIRNKFEFIKKNIITGKTLKKETSYNIVTKNGLDHFLNHNRNLWKYMHFGTGAGIPTEDNFSMFTWLTQKTVTRDTYYYEDDFRCWVGKYRAVITANTHTGSTITEVGLSSSTTDGSLNTHSMENETGGVLGITIEENEEITVYAYLYITTEDSEGFIWAKNSNNFIRNMLWESSNHHYILPMKHKKITNYTTPQDKGYSTYTASGNQNLASSVTVDDINKIRQYKILIEPTYAPNEYIKGFQISDSSPSSGGSTYYGVGDGYGGGFGYIPLPIVNSNTQENLVAYEKSFSMDGTTLEHPLSSELEGIDKARAEVYHDDGTTKTLLTEGVDYSWGKKYSHSLGVNNYSVGSWQSRDKYPIPYLAYNGRVDSPKMYMYSHLNGNDNTNGSSTAYFGYDVTGEFGDKKKIETFNEINQPFVIGRHANDPWRFPLGHYDDVENLKNTNLYIFKRNYSTAQTLYQKNKETNPISNDYNTNIVPMAVYNPKHYLLGSYINKDLGKIFTLSSSGSTGNVAFYDYRITASETLEVAIINSQGLSILDRASASAHNSIWYYGKNLYLYGEKYPTHLILTGIGSHDIYSIDWVNNIIEDISPVSIVDILDVEIPFVRQIVPNEDWTKMFILEGENFSDYNISTYAFDNMTMKLGERLDSFNLEGIGIAPFTYSSANLSVSKNGDAFYIMRQKEEIIFSKNGTEFSIYKNLSRRDRGRYNQRMEVEKTNGGTLVISSAMEDYRFYYDAPTLKLTEGYQIGDIVTVENIYQPYLWKHDNNRMELTVKVKYLINQI